MTLREPYWMDCFSPSTRRACLANRDGTHWQEGQSFVGFPHRGNNADVMALRQVFGWFLSCNKPRLREAVADRPCRRREGFDRPQV